MDTRINRQGAKTAKNAKDGDWPEPPPELDALAYDVIGAAIEVHHRLGPGFLESVYEEAMSVELALRGIPFHRQITFPVHYKDREIARSKLDFLVDEQLVLELKAVEDLRPIHIAQTLSYLRAGEFQLGLLINFHVMRLRDGIRRVVWTG